MDSWWLIGLGVVLVIVAWYLLGTSGPKGVRERAKHLEDRYDPNLPSWLAIWRYLGAKWRTLLLGHIKSETIAQASVLTTESEIQRVELNAVYDIEREKEKRVLEVSTFQNQNVTLEEATANKMTPLAWDEIQKKEHETRIELRHRWDEIEGSTDAAKDDKLKFLNGYIKNMERDFRGQQKRLLQAPTREDQGRGDEDSQSQRSPGRTI